MPARFSPLFLLLALSAAAFGAEPGDVRGGVEVLTGGGSGVFIARNPGGVYANPLSAELTAGVRMPRDPDLIGHGAIVVAPYLPIDPTFGTSFLAVIEVRFGARWELIELDRGTVSVGGTLGGGGYLRTIRGDRAEGTSRRPVATVSPMIALRLFSWEYRLSARYRVLFDRTPVHSIEPAITALYRFAVPRAEE